jgi:hypothetical protein
MLRCVVREGGVKLLPGDGDFFFKAFKLIRSRATLPPYGADVSFVFYLSHEQKNKTAALPVIGRKVQDESLIKKCNYAIE